MEALEAENRYIFGISTSLYLIQFFGFFFPNLIPFWACLDFLYSSQEIAPDISVAFAIKIIPALSVGIFKFNVYLVSHAPPRSRSSLDPLIRNAGLS